METIEYFNTSRHPVVGDEYSPWYNEPDKVQWEDEATGFPCLAIRGELGAWHGYVGVDTSHPLFGITHQEINKNEFILYGGLTFTGSSQKVKKGEEDIGICYISRGEEVTDIWWLGFNYAHCWNYVPSVDFNPLVSSDAVYFSEKYYGSIERIKIECQAFAIQLKSYKEKQARYGAIDKQPVRVQRLRSKGFNLQAASPNGLPVVYVGRPTKWGNNHRIEDYGGDVEVCLRKYKEDIELLDSTGEIDLSELSGKNLACWCSLDNPCHADVLLRMVNNSDTE